MRGKKEERRRRRRIGRGRKDTFSTNCNRLQNVHYDANILLVVFRSIFMKADDGNGSL